MKLIPNDCIKPIFQILLLSSNAINFISSTNSKATVNLSNLLVARQNLQPTIINNNGDSNQSQNSQKTADGVDIKNELPQRFQQNFEKRDEIVNILHQPPLTEKTNNQKTILLLFKGAITHHTKRLALRDFYKNEVSPHLKGKNFNIQVKFLVGTDSKKQSNSISTLDEQILKEAQNYEDMIIGDFEDTYENLVLKSLLGLQWFTDLEDSYRPEYMLLIDDDVSVQVEDLVKLLKNKEEEIDREKNHHHLTFNQRKSLSVNADLDSDETTKEQEPMLLCPWKNARRARVSRRGPWAVPIKSYPTNFWPSYCGGACYLLNFSAAEKLYEAAKTAVAYDVKVEDAFVTGVLRVRAGFDLESTRPICQHNLSKDSVTGQFLENRKNGVLRNGNEEVHLNTFQRMK